MGAGGSPVRVSAPCTGAVGTEGPRGLCTELAPLITSRLSSTRGTLAQHSGKGRVPGREGGTLVNPLLRAEGGAPKEPRGEGSEALQESPGPSAPAAAVGGEGPVPKMGVGWTPPQALGRKGRGTATPGDPPQEHQGQRRGGGVGPRRGCNGRWAPTSSFCRARGRKEAGAENQMELGFFVFWFFTAPPAAHGSSWARD